MAVKLSTNDEPKNEKDWQFKDFRVEKIDPFFIKNMVKFRQFFSFGKKEIEQAFKQTSLKQKIDGLKLLQAPLQKETEPKYGKLLIVIPAKSGKAHKRNLIKRQLKAIFFEEKLYKKPIISILIVYKSAMELSFDELKKFLVKNLK